METHNQGLPIPGNIFQALPDNLDHELIETLIANKNLKIERILSKGHSSPDTGWYDQQQNEWVIILQGKAVLCFESTDGSETEVLLEEGSYINIPSHTRHRVKSTAEMVETIWLAIHYD